MSVQIVRRLNERQELLKEGNAFYVLSQNAFDPEEYLVFESDENGEITNWQSVSGSYHATKEAAITELESKTGDQ